MERPILFSTAMVQAILEGRKTQTRRIVKFPLKSPTHHISINDCDSPPPTSWAKYEVGDLLWVRETLYQEGELGLYYVADNEPILEETLPEDYTVYRNYAHCKVPNIHMQKSVARIWLEVTDIRVERLHDISEDDAKGEGVEVVKVCNLSDPNDKIRYRDYRFSDPYAPNARLWATAKRSFETLWQKINGHESFGANPWVWVVSFKVLSTTGKPKEVATP